VTQLFWAFEFNRHEAIQFLITHGADANARDQAGKLPKDMFNANAGINVNFKPAAGSNVKVISNEEIASKAAAKAAEEAKRKQEAEQKLREEEEAALLREIKERAASTSNMDEL